MHRKTWNLLIVEDDEEDYILTREMLRAGNMQSADITWAKTYEEGEEYLDDCRFDAVLIDYALGAKSGLGLVRASVAKGCSSALILLTGHSSYELDVKAMEVGADEYLAKGEITPPLLERAIRYAVERKQVERALREARDHLEMRVEERTKELLKKHEDLLDEITERMRAEERARRVAEHAEALADISRMLAAAGSNSVEVLDRVAQKVTELVGDNTMIALITEGGDHLQTVAYHDSDPGAHAFLGELLSKPFELGQGLSGKVAETGETALIQQIDQNEARQKINPTYLPYFEQYGIHSLIIVPLKTKDRVLGTLGVTRRHPDKPYQTEDVAFIEDLGGRIALSIYNADLYRALEKELAERLRAEEELRDSKDLFESLFQSAPNSIMLINHEGCIERANRETLTLFGYMPQELIGKPIDTLVPAAKQDEYSFLRQGYLPNPLTRAMGATMELYGRRKNGEEFPVDLTLSPISNSKDSQVICIVHDITYRKQAEDALRRSEARFRTIFEHSALGIKLLDLDGNLLAVNEAVEEMLGIDSEELVGTSFVEFTHPGDVYRNRMLFDELIHGKRNDFRLEKRYIHREGHIVWGRLTLTLVRDEDDSPLFAVGMLENITERKQIEADLAELQRRLIDSAESERLYVAQELHDGPMQDLYGVTYKLAGVRANLDDNNGLELRDVEQSLKQIVGALRSIAGELRPPTLAPFGLEKALQDHAERFANQHPELKVHIDMDSDGKQLPKRVRLALFRIYQVAVTNIIRHADADQVEIVFRMDDDAAVLEIADNGVGFDLPERWITLARRGHMGLVGAQERAEAIGGRLEIHTAPGEGTRIRVVVPRPFVGDEDEE